MSKILEVKDLAVSFHTYAGEVKAVRGVSFDLDEGETLAIVGESGCGKSITAKSIMRLLPTPPAEIGKNSKIICDGKDVLSLNKKELQNFRGGEVSMIFQDPMTSLNPTMKIGKQITEVLKIHRGMNKKEARDEAIRLLKLVNIPNAEARIDQYPFEFSGGMRQRMMIAIALACNPKILIADEPTTALDVTIQAQIMNLIDELKNKFNTSVILITHDLGVVAEFSDKIQVMYAGIVVERGTVKEIFCDSKHPYTWALLKSMPTLDTEHKGELYSISGTPPDLLNPPVGCPFAARCEYAMEICKEAMPEETIITDSHKVNCWLMHENAPKIESPLKRGV
ncbi:oligopeptide transport system ATP-binding protein [Clostridium moniliforme]|uniref:Oligopeptide transport system ATP-binding protein n=1 Tax=Clostridium moniliforme TaxID=39489 RepID=A0ABS4EYW0_9CLOT|nr:ABC transporter ATP-binding protein [Clostridium moniliforme]MBP1889184.1 oligopeptide transport system ATP-binding protein [Clostridium moniliforme]